MGSKAPQRAPRGPKPKPPPKSGGNGFQPACPDNLVNTPLEDLKSPSGESGLSAVVPGRQPKDRAMALAHLAWDLAEENRARIESIERRLGL